MLIFRVANIDSEILQAFQRLMPQLTTNVAPPSREQLQTLIDFQGSILLAARLHENGPILGLATVCLIRSPAGAHARLEDVVVDHAARGQGMGAALTAEALRLAREWGARYMALTSNPRRAAANQLYQKLGFHRWETNVYRFDLV